MNPTLMQIGGSAPQSSAWQSVFLMVAIFAIMYFFMLRPQRKKQKELQAQREALKVGSRVVTAGGIYGEVKDIKEHAFVVEIADGVRIKVDKGSIYPVVEKK